MGKIKTIQASAGKKWTLTENGLEIARIRAKFKSDYANRSQYEISVPKDWVDNGYVVEVDIKESEDKK